MKNILLFVILLGVISPMIAQSGTVSCHPIANGTGYVYYPGYFKYDGDISVSNSSIIERRGYAIFDISAIPTNAIIDNANLGIQVSKGFSSSSSTLEFRQINSADQTLPYDLYTWPSDQDLYNKINGITYGSVTNTYSNYFIPLARCVLNSTAKTNIQRQLSQCYYQFGVGFWTSSNDATDLKGTYYPYLNLSYSCPKYTAASGTITDGSGTGNYKDNMKSYWLIQPTGAQGITLNFTTFYTEPSCDFVNIYGGTTISDPLLGSYSGTDIPTTIKYSGGSVLVEFISDYSNTFSGWSVNYSSCNVQVLDPDYVNATSFEICQGNSTTLSYSGGTGSTFRWYSGSCGGTLVGSGNNLSVTPSQTTTYYGRWEGSCGNSNCYELTINVKPVPVKPTSVSASNTSICPNEWVELRYTGGSGETFHWHTGACAGTEIGIGYNLAVRPSVTTTYYGRWSNSCTYSNCLSVTVNVQSNLAQPGAIAGNTTVCHNSIQTYSVSPVTGASYYVWVLPSGWTGESSSNSIEVTPGATSGNISVTAYSDCVNSISRTLYLTVIEEPGQPGPITGNAIVSPGSSQVYSISPMSGATSYTWKLPMSWTGNSTSNKITTTAGNGSGEISVIANNSCGFSSTPTILPVTSYCEGPPQPGVITGNTSICQGSSQTYSVQAVTGAVSYTWTIPQGWSGYSGTNSITITPNNSSGSISVQANNSCRPGAERSLDITVNPWPDQPELITGSLSACPGSQLTYSVPEVLGAISYTWMLPSGWTGTSTINSITTTAGSSSGNVSVTANNSCGPSTARSLTVTANSAPAQPGSITGNTTVAQGSSQIYNVTAVPDANSYTWTLPSGWIGTSTTNSISCTAGANGGIISVTANNDCGPGTPRSISVTSSCNVPSQPGTISGNTAVCQGSTQTYSIVAVSGATSYTWSLPSSWSGSSTSTSITATVGASGGNVSVTANNSCGASTLRSMTVTVNTVPAQPGTISGNTSVTQGLAQTYSVTAVPGATSYTWALPSGWSGTSTTNSISCTAGTNGGTISVTANNDCGPGTPRSISVTSSCNVPSQPGTISGNTAVCQGSTQTYSIVAVSGATSYTWSLPSGWSGSSTSQSITATVGASGGNVSVTANNLCGASILRSMAVTVNTVPAQPGAISGNTSVTQGSSQTYNVTAVSGATSYTWTLPSGWTGTSTTNSINITAGANGGTISVAANNACGSSTTRTLAVSVVAVSPTLAVAPQALYVKSPAGSKQFSVTSNSSWTASSNQSWCSVTTSGSGNGTITATFTANTGTSARNANVTVTVAGLIPQTITVTQQGIMPPENGCTIFIDNFDNLNNLTLFGSPLPVIVNAFAGRTNLFDNNGDGNNNSGAISKTAYDLNGGFILEGEVYLDFNDLSGCWNSADIGIADPVYQSWGGYNPNMIFSYNANGDACWGSPAETRRHAILNGGYKTNAGWESFGDLATNPIYADSCLGKWNKLRIIVGTDKIPVFYLNNSLLYIGKESLADLLYQQNSPVWLGERSSGSAGKAYHDWVQLKKLTSSAPAQPGIISGNTPVCQGSSQTYSITAVAGATSYTWTLPSGWSGSSTTTSISTTVAASGGNVSVTANNTCGSSTPRALAVTVNTVPGQPGNISGNTSVTQGSAQPYSVTAVSGATSYTWTLPTGWTGSSTTNSTNVTAGASGGTISVTANNSCGSSTPRTLAVSSSCNVPAQPGAILGSTEVCQGPSQTYSITAVSGATSYTWTLPNGWTGSSTTNSITTTVGANSGNVSVTANNACGSSAPRTWAVTVNNQPTAPSGVSASVTPVCQGNSTTLTYNGGSGITFKWYAGSCGGTPIGEGNNLPVIPSSTTTYYGRWENSCGNSECKSVTVTVNPQPVAPTSVSTTNPVCQGNSTTLSYIGGSGTSFMWYAGSCGGTPVGEGNNLPVSPTSAATYYGRWENSCGNSECKSVTVTVNSQPVAPTSVSATSPICQGSSSTLTYNGGSGTTFKWYAGSCSGTPVGEGNNLTVSPTSTTTYFGKWENNCNYSDCKSVTITVNNQPTAPSSVSTSVNPVCQGNSTTLSYNGGSGTTFKWYTGSCGGTSIGEGNNLPVTPSSTTTYYGRWENSCGNSECKSVTVTVNPQPVAPTSVSATSPICQGGSTTLSYNGGSGTTFKWYAGSCGGTPIGEGNNLPVTPSSTTTYYGRWENSCGNSECKSVTVTINPQPVAPTSVSATSPICQGGSTTLSYNGGSGTTFKWYANSCGGTPVGEGNNLSVTPSSTTTYYGRWENSCGNSECKSVTVTVNPLPVAPTSVSATSPICQVSSTTLSYIGGSGTTFKWYTGSCGGTSIGEGNNLPVTPSSTTTYYGRWENSCGNSECKSVTVTVNPLPVAPTSVSATSPICQGNSTTLTYNGGSGITFKWYTGSCGGTPVGEGNNLTVTPSSTTTYYGRWENSCGNSECKLVTVTVNTKPEKPGTIKGKDKVSTGMSEPYSINPINGATSYTWTLPDTSWKGNPNTTSIVTTVGSKSGQITIKANNQCGSSEAQTLWVEVYPDGIKILTSQDIQIYPNPFTEKVTIKFALSYSGKVYIRVMDVYGKSVLVREIEGIKENTTQLIEMNNLPVGIYNLIISSDDWMKADKIVKQ